VRVCVCARAAVHERHICNWLLHARTAVPLIPWKSGISLADPVLINSGWLRSGEARACERYSALRRGALANLITPEIP